MTNSNPSTPLPEPEQWAIKQHIEKYPKCEWLCTHTNQHNLGEQEPDTPLPEQGGFNELTMANSPHLENLYTAIDDVFLITGKKKGERQKEAVLYIVKAYALDATIGELSKVFPGTRGVYWSKNEVTMSIPLSERIGQLRAIRGRLGGTHDTK